MDDKKRDDYETELRNLNRSPSQKEPFLSPRPPVTKAPSSMADITNNPALAILAYCLASISMTVVNKYCVSGPSWNLSFFLLCVQVRVSGGPPPDRRRG